MTLAFVKARNPSGGIGGLTRFVQSPQILVMLSEDLTYRQVFLYGRELPKDPNPAWMGYSISGLGGLGSLG